ncbi:MAG: metal ABC transporter permease [Desulfovibrio sp.]|jgi:zinc transport system permease protein|nr:metal ABC transporter permease [Desulfovibrio sp.]
MRLMPPDLSPVYAWLGALPLECMQAAFMQRAFFALLLLAPMAATLGVHVVNARMSFFSDAISHSAFAGVALGLILGVHPSLAMPLFGLLVGLGIVAVQRGSLLPPDTVIGVFFSGAVAFGLAVISREGTAARDVRQFLYGDILTVSQADIAWLLLLGLALLLFQILAFNSMILLGLDSRVAKAHGVRTALCQYVFAALLSLVVMFSVQAVGVLLVTALLIVPAATARNLARSAGGMFWWAALAGASSAVGGLLLSTRDWPGTASGATIILIACAWFCLSLILRRFFRG